MVIKATVFEAREITIENNFCTDSAGRMYRLYADKNTGALYADVVDTVNGKIVRDEIITNNRLESLIPASGADYLNALIGVTEDSLLKDIGVTLGVGIDAVHISWLTTQDAEEMNAAAEAETQAKAKARKAAKKREPETAYDKAMRSLCFSISRACLHFGQVMTPEDAYKLARVTADYLREHGLLKADIYTAFKRGLEKCIPPVVYPPVCPKNMINWIEEGLKNG